MREMKDSGIEWIGEIPKEWKINRGKAVLDLLTRPVEKADEVITCFRDGEVTLRKHRREEGFTFSDKEIGYQGINAGDIVIHGMDGFAGAIGISDSRGKGSPVLIVCDSNQNKKYLIYYLRSLAFRNIFTALATGIRVRSCDLRWNKISVLPFVLPPLPEQRRIADYLDIACGKVDALIANQQAQIEKLKAYKQSLITEVVTHGLDPDVPMKDSGVEWIGMIPEGWEVIRIPYILDRTHPYPIGDGDHGLIGPDDYQDEGIPYIRVQNLGWATELQLDNLVYISEELNRKIKNSTLHPNDILFAKTGATIGKTGMVPLDMPIANTTSHVGKLTVDNKYNPRFVFYVLSSYIGYRQFWSIACQKTTRPELAISEIKAIRILMPSSRTEQDKIVEALDEKLIKADKLIAIKQQKIEKLTEYKKSLIYEYVTGKKSPPQRLALSEGEPY